MANDNDDDIDDNTFIARPPPQRRSARLQPNTGEDDGCVVTIHRSTAFPPNAVRDHGGTVGTSNCVLPDHHITTGSSDARNNARARMPSRKRPAPSAAIPPPKMPRTRSRAAQEQEQQEQQTLVHTHTLVQQLQQSRDLAHIRTHASNVGMRDHVEALQPLQPQQPQQPQQPRQARAHARDDNTPPDESVSNNVVAPSQLDRSLTGNNTQEQVLPTGEARVQLRCMNVETKEECPLCFEELDPSCLVLLQGCEHKVCAECLASMHRHYGKSVSCPRCAQRSGGELVVLD